MEQISRFDNLPDGNKEHLNSTAGFYFFKETASLMKKSREKWWHEDINVMIQAKPQII